MSSKHSLRTTVAAITTVLAALTFAPTTLRAQQLEKNETGLPAYPHFKTGSQYQATAGGGRPAPPPINGKRYQIYVASTPDTMPTVIAWYKKALPGAKASVEPARGVSGPTTVLVTGSNRVLIYIVGKRGTIVELQKYVPGA
ncbi:MAG: hypothetical protein ABI664_17180 [bacterium]